VAIARDRHPVAIARDRHPVAIARDRHPVAIALDRHPVAIALDRHPVAIALAGPGALVDAVLAVVDSAIVTASDIALARALALMGFTPSRAPIDAADVERYVRVVLVLGEARRLAIEAPSAEIEAAWRAVEGRAGGRAALDEWLTEVRVGREWAERGVESHVRWRRFIELRFGELAFVTPDEVTAALGAGLHSSEARARAYDQLRASKAEDALGQWLDARTRQASVRRLLAGGERAPLPFGPPAQPRDGGDSGGDGAAMRSAGSGHGSGRDGPGVVR
jgi:hypothetical protein